jgi:hypothetical protein
VQPKGKINFRLKQLTRKHKHHTRLDCSAELGLLLVVLLEDLVQWEAQQQERHLFNDKT